MDKSFPEAYLDLKQTNPGTMNQAILDTLYMILISMVSATTIGSVLGLVLHSIGRKSKLYTRIVYKIVSIIGNIFQSTLFMILMVLIVSFIKAIVGTMLGAQATILVLVLLAAPFYARLVEIAFREVSPGVLEAASAMGASYWEIIWKVLIPESTPASTSKLVITTISMTGSIAMADVIDVGGLGGLAQQEDYRRGNPTVTFTAILIILLIVFIVQEVSSFLTKKVDKR